MEPRTLQQTTDDMRGHIRRMTAEGFHTPDEIAASAVQVFLEEQAQEVLERIAERLTREAVRAHFDAQKKWPPVTDCDLLDRAFGELNRAGIVARHHFTCCGT